MNEVQGDWMLRDFDPSDEERLQRILSSIRRHEERYLKAWIAETGLKPSECILIYDMYNPDGKSSFRVEPREDVYERVRENVRLRDLLKIAIEELARISYETENKLRREEIKNLTSRLSQGLGKAPIFRDGGTDE